MKLASLTFVLGAAIALGPGISAVQTGTQSVQYRSTTGVEYRSLLDTEAVAKHAAALAADPRHVARIIDLGVAQSGARQFREAIATFTRGLEIEPNDALLLDGAGTGISRSVNSIGPWQTSRAALPSTARSSGIWYHLGIVRTPWRVFRGGGVVCQSVATRPRRASGFRTIGSVGRMAGLRVHSFGGRVRACPEIGASSWAPRRPDRKARGGSMPGACDRRATPRGGMHRWPDGGSLPDGPLDRLR